MTAAPRQVHSADNPLLQQIRRLQQDPMAYRKLGRLWIEGEHLAQAVVAHGWRAEAAVFAESVWAATPAPALREAAATCVVVSDRLFKALSGLPSPAGLGLLCTVPSAPAIQPRMPSVVLDRLQDAGNVGSILRSAAAMGVGQVIALKGTAGLWSPKVLRAGMGAQFGLALIEAQDEAALQALAVPLVATSSHAETDIVHAELPTPCAWAFGHEGQGVRESLLARCAMTVRIPQPGGQESLNVAAAAAICLYESMRRALPA